MINLYVYLIGIILFFSSLYVGTIMYKRDYSKRFNFLNHFPFELKTNFNIRLLNAFRAGLIGSIIILCISIYFTFYQSVDGSFTSKFASFFLIIEGIIIASLFFVPFYYYYPRLFLSLCLMVINLVNSLLLCFNAFMKVGINNVFYFGFFYIPLTTVSFVLSTFPITKLWYMNYIDKENNVRKKVIPFASVEWINIILYLLIILVGIIRSLFY